MRRTRGERRYSRYEHSSRGDLRTLGQKGARVRRRDIVSCRQVMEGSAATRSDQINNDAQKRGHHHDEQWAVAGASPFGR